MVPDLKGSHPDDAYSVIPYEKGHTLLFYMETIVGVDAMDSYLKAYIAEYARKSLTTKEWLAFTLAFFKDSPSLETKLKGIDWDNWFYSTGMPPIIPDYDETYLKQVQKLTKSWSTDHPFLRSASPAEFLALSVWQKALFLDMLHEDAHPSEEILREIDVTYQMNTVRKNAEIAYRWFRLILDSGYVTPTNLALIEEFLGTNGRMKYIRPIYKALYKSCHGKYLHVAKEVYKKFRQVYHPIAQHQIEKDLHIE